MPKKNKKKKHPDRGWWYERTKHQASKLEKALAELWEERNSLPQGVGFGHGILQDLFIDYHLYSSLSDKFGMARVEIHHEITHQERMVVATVVQWLGSDCGQVLLRDACSRAGMKYEIKPIAEDD